MLPLVAWTVTEPVTGVFPIPLPPEELEPPQATMVSRARIASVVSAIQRRREFFPAINTEPKRAARVLSIANGRWGVRLPASDELAAIETVTVSFGVTRGMVAPLAFFSVQVEEPRLLETAQVGFTVPLKPSSAQKLGPANPVPPPLTAR